MFERSRKGEHALLIQPHAGGPPDEGLLEEFADLARTAGASVAAVLTARIDNPQIECGITRTTTATHDIIRSSLDRSPLFSGVIEGVGPRTS